MIQLNNRHYIFVTIVSICLLWCHHYSDTTFIQTAESILLKLFFIYLVWNLSAFIYSLPLVPKQRIDPSGKAVLITGCDSGFGHLLAIRLVNQGYYVFAACLSPNSDGAQKLAQEYDENRLMVVPLDVTKEDSVQNARSLVEQRLKKEKGHLGLWAVVNNAGILALSEVEFGPMKTFERQMEVNCMGIVRVTKSFVPLIRHNPKLNLQQRGRVVNVASLAGRFTMPGFVAYCMSKGAVITFSDGLRRELSKWNIDVVCIEPHLYKTNLVNRERVSLELEQSWTQTPLDIQQDYGREYYDGFVTTMNTVMDTARDTIHQVVHTLEDAVTLEQVDQYYQVMKVWEKARVWLFANIVPVPVLDYMLQKVLTNGVPRATIQNSTISN